jgi:hypothetical protein
MRKTTYIPKGTELRVKALTCENIVVNGSFRAEGAVRAKRISGKGFVSADSVSADFVSAGDICADTIVTDVLIAKRIEATEIYATHEILASSHIRADFAKTGRLIAAGSAVSEIEADEIVKLSQKPRGILGALFAAFVRSKFAALFAKRPKGTKPCERVKTKRGKTGPEAAPGPSDRKTAKPAAPRERDIPEGILAASRDFEITAAIHEALNSGEYVLRITPKEKSSETSEANPFADEIKSEEAEGGQNAA